jgi:AraC-like DNA-binding protein
LVRETYVAVLELIEDPTNGGVLVRLDDIRERFEDAAEIFDQALLEMEEEVRRLQRQAVRERDEHATDLAAARDGFARELAATRDEFAGRLADAESETRYLAERVDEANRELARAEDIVAYMAARYGQKRRSRMRARFRDYWRLSSRARKELEAVRCSILFDEEHYLNSNPDVRTAGMDAALHYLLHGGREGRDPGPLFSTRRYFARFPDVAASGINAIVHYETYGRRERRNFPLWSG